MSKARAILGGLVLAVAGALPGCQCCVDGPQPHAVSAQPLGARCEHGSDCVAGLECMGGTCTISCAASPSVCATGSTCAEEIRDGNGNLLRTCLPTCIADADCRLGATVGSCLSPSFGSGTCVARRCETDADCAGTGRCVGVSEARGITWNQTCSDGYCQL